MICDRVYEGSAFFDGVGGYGVLLGEEKCREGCEEEEGEAGIHGSFLALVGLLEISCCSKIEILRNLGSSDQGFGKDGWYKYIYVAKSPPPREVSHSSRKNLYVIGTSDSNSDSGTVRV